MKNRLYLPILFCFCTITAIAQDEEEDIVAIVDDLTLQWDTSAEKLETYDGLRDYCRVKAYRDNTILLLNQIHHYDSTLYNIVRTKFEASEDEEARATLDDILTLESEYTTREFLKFLRQECMAYNDNERNKNIEGYEGQVKALEAELAKYVKSITRQIDIVDEHIHHLKGL